MRTDRFAFHVLGWAVCFYLAGVLFEGIRHWLWPGEAWFPLVRLWLVKNGVPPAVVYSLALALLASVIDREWIRFRLRNDLAVLAAEGTSWRERTRLAAIARYVRECNDPAMRTLYRASVLGKQIMVTLNGGKVYVSSLVAQLKDPTTMAAFTRLIPTVGGYRDPQTFKVTFTTAYSDLNIETDPPNGDGAPSADEQLDPLRSDPALLRTRDGVERTIDLEDVGIVLLWSDIISLTMFDPGLYRAFQDRDEIPDVQSTDPSG
jgi:hypothetical protein